MARTGLQKPPLIQVVDDDLAMRMLMRAALVKAGFEVAEAKNGMEAIAIFEQLRPDAMLLDVMMPEMDGYETCSAIRRLPGGDHTPVLMVTGLDDIESIHKAFEVKATDFITKPINWAILIYRVRYMLRANEAFQQVKKNQDQIRHLAYYDHLTGLANRPLFIDSLEKTLASATRHNRKMAILFLDIDRFKRINDTLGHHIGDLLLKKIAERINRCIRETDTATRLGQDESTNCISRLGGDEFTILLSEIAHPEDAAKVAQRILDVIPQPMNLEGQEVFVTTSIGISVFPIDGKNTENLMKNADTAMYHAKEKGRNNFQFYKESLNTSASEKLELENDIRRALKRDEFMLYYQPQLDARSRRIIGVESLIRWQHPTRGFVSPGDFLPIAEESGLIIPLTEWVLSTACSQNKNWQVEGLKPIRVSVNLSGHHFNQLKITEMVERVLQYSQLEPKYLEVEITEGTLIENKDEVKSTLQLLKDLGLTIAIDDFGTGYSSLAYLKTFPIDTLKIDQSFVRDISSDPNDAAITKAIVAMAHSLDLNVIAEGVETNDQLDFLRELGCSNVQGFLFSRPLPADEFAVLLMKETLADVNLKQVQSRGFGFIKVSV